eukprot:s50_g2.t1
MGSGLNAFLKGKARWIRGDLLKVVELIADSPVQLLSSKDTMIQEMPAPAAESEGNLNLIPSTWRPTMHQVEPLAALMLSESWPWRRCETSEAANEASFATFAATTPVPVMPLNHAVQDNAVELFLVIYFAIYS